MKMKRLLLMMYLTVALIIFGAVALNYHSRVIATVPTQEGIQFAIEHGNVNTIENTIIYDYSTEHERYIVTVTGDNIDVLFENRNTEIAVHLVNGKKMETIDMRHERSQIKRIFFLSQEQWMGFFAIVGMLGIGAFLVYGFWIKKD